MSQLSASLDLDFEEALLDMIPQSVFWASCLHYRFGKVIFFKAFHEDRLNHFLVTSSLLQHD